LFNVANEHTYVGRVVEPQALVQSADLLNLILLEVEAADIEVLCKTRLVVALGNDSNAALGRPAKEDLRRALSVSVGNALDDVVVEEHGGVLRLLHVELDERERAERAVGSHGDVALLAELEERLLSEVWVVLDLESLRNLLCVAEQVEEKSTVVVANAEGLDETLLVQSLHGVVCLLKGGVAEFDLVVLVEESRRVTNRGVDVLDRNREVNDVKVKVVDTPVSELLLADGRNAVLVVEGVPQLGDNEEILTLDKTFVDCALNTLAGLDLVAVVAGAVKETVASLDGVVDLISAGVVVHLPKTEANERHLTAIVKLDSGSRHGSGGKASECVVCS